MVEERSIGIVLHALAAMLSMCLLQVSVGSTVRLNILGCLYSVVGLQIESSVIFKSEG